jgi:teichuronic acid biosynthesis glycosyltransferase TuaG
LISAGLEMDEVSVIIPTWNRGSMIRKAILSVLKQDVLPLEILVCDDGSTDNTERIVKEFGDPRVRWLPGCHAGRPAVPRNRGILESKGEWLAFLDSDDAWLPKKLERQLETVKEQGCKASCTNAVRYVPGKGDLGSLLTWRKHRITLADLIGKNVIICSSALIHRSVLNRAKGFPEETSLRALEDYALWLRISTETDFAYVEEPQVIYLDDVENSIRAESENVLAQRSRVLANLSGWARTQKIAPDYRKRIERALFKNAVLTIMADSMQAVSRLKRKLYQ